MTDPTAAARLARDARDLAIHVAALERHVANFDPVAATHARQALRELETLAELLAEPARP